MAIIIMEKQMRRVMDGTWVCTPLTEAVLQELETYAARHQNTFTQYISTRNIVDLYLAAERRLGTRVYKR